MRLISMKQRQEMNIDPFMKASCLSGGSPVEWHHNMIYGGKQSNEWWTILPLTKEEHRKADNKEIKEKLNWIMLNRARDSEILPFCKAVNYLAMKNKLNEKYGVYHFKR